HLFFPLLRPPPPPSTLFPYTTLFRSGDRPLIVVEGEAFAEIFGALNIESLPRSAFGIASRDVPRWIQGGTLLIEEVADLSRQQQDRKSTRLNSSHRTISYAVFCLKKK